MNFSGPEVRTGQGLTSGTLLLVEWPHPEARADRISLCWSCWSRGALDGEEQVLLLREGAWQDCGASSTVQQREFRP